MMNLRLVSLAVAAVAVSAVVILFLPPSTHMARAAAALAGESSCDPASVRPNVAVVMTCTTRLTNQGDVAATHLVVNIGLANDCTIPNRFAFVDRTTNGQLVAMGSLELSFPIPDLAAGGTNVSVTRVAVLNTSTGRTGGSITVASQDDPNVRLTASVCWNVATDAAAPATHLQVTKHALTVPAPPVFPTPPPAPPGGGPVPVQQPTSPAEAQFDITVTNTGSEAVAGVTLMDAPTNGGVLVRSDPTATGSDALGRPTWDLGTLAAGDARHITATLGAPPGANCANADDIAVLAATASGGVVDDYAAFSDSTVPVGPCDFGGGKLCWHYPPEGQPIPAPCNEEICWTSSQGVSGYTPVEPCNPTVDYCLFTPPGTTAGLRTMLAPAAPIGPGSTSPQPCSNQVCWMSFGDSQSNYYSEVPCNSQFCRFTAPDGVTSMTQGCEPSPCWSSAPGTAEWRPVSDCGQSTGWCWFAPPGQGPATLRGCNEQLCWLAFGSSFSEVPCDVNLCKYTAPDGTTSTSGPCGSSTCWTSPPEGGGWEYFYTCAPTGDGPCWFTPSGGGLSLLGSCSVAIRFAVHPPDGAITLGPLSVQFQGDACWPVPPSPGAFYTLPIPCNSVPSIRWFTPENGGPAVPSQGLEEACWQSLPPGIVLPPGYNLPPDFQFPGPCRPGQQGKVGVTGSSVPAEVAAATSTPAVLVQGTVTPIQPQASASVTPADLVQGTIEHIQPQPSVSVTPAQLFRTDTLLQLRGDANCDHGVNSIDSAVILQYGANLINSLACAGNADVNHDGRIDAIDAALVLQYGAGLVPTL